MGKYTEVTVDASYTPHYSYGAGRLIMAVCAAPLDHIYLAIRREGREGVHTADSTVWLDVEEIDELIDALYCLREEIEPYDEEAEEDGHD